MNELLKLTERGKSIVSSNDAQSKLDAVMSVPIFKNFFEEYGGNGLPSEAAAIDFLKGNGVPEDRATECLKILLNTGRSVKLIKEASGKERVLSIEHALEELGGESPKINETNSDIDAADLEDKKNHKPTKKFIGGFPALNINIQIELPGNATPEQYESIFKNMRTYLIDENAG